jgi:hypothetical protein
MRDICSVIDCDNPRYLESPYCEEHTTDEDKLEFRAAYILNQIQTNSELIEREIGGLREGERRGKKPTVSIDVLMMALQKQFRDLQQDYALYDPCWVGRAKKDLADLRNVAGILFLVLDGKAPVIEIKKDEGQKP